MRCVCILQENFSEHLLHVRCKWFIFCACVMSIMADMTIDSKVEVKLREICLFASMIRRFQSSLVYYGTKWRSRPNIILLASLAYLK